MTMEKHTPFPTLTLEEAISMLPDGPTIPVRYEADPNTGISHCWDAPREQLINYIKTAHERNFLFVSGAYGIKLGFGFHFEVTNFKNGTRGNLFVTTRNPN